MLRTVLTRALLGGRGSALAPALARSCREYSTPGPVGITAQTPDDILARKARLLLRPCALEVYVSA